MLPASFGWIRYEIYGLLLTVLILFTIFFPPVLMYVTVLYCDMIGSLTVWFPSLNKLIFIKYICISLLDPSPSSPVQFWHVQGHHCCTKVCFQWKLDIWKVFCYFLSNNICIFITERPAIEEDIWSFGKVILLILHCENSPLHVKVLICKYYQQNLLKVWK